MGRSGWRAAKHVVQEMTLTLLWYVSEDPRRRLGARGRRQLLKATVVPKSGLNPWRARLCACARTGKISRRESGSSTKYLLKLGPCAIRLRASGPGTSSKARRVAKPLGTTEPPREPDPSPTGRSTPECARSFSVTKRNLGDVRGRPPSF